MPRYRSIGILVSLCFFHSSLWAQDQGTPEAMSYLNGYIAGRALSRYYKDEERKEFTRGLLKGISEPPEPSISGATVRDAKVTWFSDTERSKKQQASYAAGYLSGDAYKGPDSMYSVYDYLQGLLDSLQSSGVHYVGKQQGTMIVTQYQRNQFYKKKRYVADTIKANERDGKTFLALNALQPGITQIESCSFSRKFK